MTFFGVTTRDERVLADNLARTQRELIKAKKGRDRLAHLLIYKELGKSKPFLTLISANLLGAGYTQEEVTTLLEETKREYEAEH